VFNLIEIKIKKLPIKNVRSEKTKTFPLPQKKLKLLTNLTMFLYYMRIVCALITRMKEYIA